jgi:uncharacterized protein (DUF4415 family)
MDTMSDEDIDTSDIPPLDESFFKEAELKMPRAKPAITIRLDPDVLDWFKGQGKGYQTRINAVLRMYMEAQRPRKLLDEVTENQGTVRRRGGKTSS